MSVRLLTTEEVAARFRTSPATVRYWGTSGSAPRGCASAAACSTTRPSATAGGRARSHTTTGDPRVPATGVAHCRWLAAG
jgi:hypothetical protein